MLASATFAKAFAINTIQKKRKPNTNSYYDTRRHTTTLYQWRAHHQRRSETQTPKNIRHIRHQQEAKNNRPPTLWNKNKTHRHQIGRKTPRGGANSSIELTSRKSNSKKKRNLGFVQFIT